MSNDETTASRRRGRAAAGEGLFGAAAAADAAPQRVQRPAPTLGLGDLFLPANVPTKADLDRRVAAAARDLAVAGGAACAYLFGR